LGGGFSAGRLEKKQEQVANYVERVFYDRPRNFDARYLPHLRQNWLVIPEEDLITVFPISQLLLVNLQQSKN
jgi:hypothetical protein